MSDSDVPSVRFRRIGLELRRLRLEAGMSIHRAGSFLGRSASSLSLIENGIQPIRPRDLEYILIKFGFEPGDPFREAMLELAQDGRKSGWWRQYSGVLTPIFMDFISLETDCRKLDSFQTLVIPGLLQTPAYARSLIKADTPREIERAVRIRMARQNVLTSCEPPEVTMILNESALWQQIGDAEVMRGQMERLIEVSELPNLSLRVIPFKAGGHRGLRGPFTKLEVGERGRLSVVTLETSQGMSYVERPEDVLRHAQIFAELRLIAMDESETRSFIDRLRSNT
ncbi:helix-turn-helix transcriptional regulator [Spirillospora sp. NPDC047279]|uniref:helix-turn-helix domain-containing protein n=1 Tax=Spirillospora sp. NPDC047279 TaxID=3155478 RepID=UPI0033C8CD30